MDRLVRDVFNALRQDNDIGIEIEVEGRRLPQPEDYMNKFSWMMDHDGSLRGPSMEYILKEPCKIQDVEERLKELWGEFGRLSTVIRDSIRAGVHVHINVQELSIKQLATFITCYFAVENVLIEFCRPDRKGNHFCLRADDAEYLTFIINQNFKEMNMFFSDDVRYSAINLCSLGKFGSVEFRCLETPKNYQKILDWANILYRLKEVSLEFDDPIDVVQSMSGMGYRHFFNRLMGEYTTNFPKRGLEQLGISSIRNAQNIAFGVDWNATGGEINFNRPLIEERDRRHQNDRIAELMQQIREENNNG